MRRRTLLTAIPLISGSAIAGCVARSDQDDDENQGTKHWRTEILDRENDEWDSPRAQFFSEQTAALSNMREEVDGVQTYIENTNFQKYYLVAIVWGLTGYDAYMELDSHRQEGDTLVVNASVENTDDNKTYPDGTTPHSLAFRLSTKEYDNISEVKADVEDNT